MEVAAVAAKAAAAAARLASKSEVEHSDPVPKESSPALTALPQRAVPLVHAMTATKPTYVLPAALVPTPTIPLPIEGLLPPLLDEAPLASKPPMAVAPANVESVQCSDDIESWLQDLPEQLLAI